MDVVVWLAEPVIEDDDENLPEAEVDALFEVTQPIGNALHALAQAELTVAAVDNLDPATEARLQQILNVALGEARGG